MTTSSIVHDELGQHLRKCQQCRDVNAEAERIKRPVHLRHSIEPNTFNRLCHEGASIYRRYLKWLDEPDD